MFWYARSANKLFPLEIYEQVTGENFRVTADSSSFKCQERLEELSVNTEPVIHNTYRSAVRSNSNMKYRQNFTTDNTPK